jgi:hypothetical protein
LRTQVVEATNGGQRNWGKFLVASFDGNEWLRQSVVSDSCIPLLAQLGHDPNAPLVLVLDLQTGEGAVFSPPVRLDIHADDDTWESFARMSAKWDLNKHQIWVCVLFEAFLAWLYARDSFDDLPEQVELSASFAMHGYRRMRLVEGAAD